MTELKTEIGGAECTQHRALAQLFVGKSVFEHDRRKRPAQIRRSRGLRLLGSAWGNRGVRAQGEPLLSGLGAESPVTTGTRTRIANNIGLCAVAHETDITD